MGEKAQGQESKHICETEHTCMLLLTAMYQ